MGQKDAAVRLCCYCCFIVQCWLGRDDKDAQSLSNLNYQIISQKNEFAAVQKQSYVLF